MQPHSRVESFLPLKPNWFHVLLSLTGQEQHGYGIMQEVLERTGGKVRLWPATLYGTLKRLIDEDLIAESGQRPEPEEDDARRAVPGGGLQSRCGATGARFYHAVQAHLSGGIGGPRLGAGVRTSVAGQAELRSRTDLHRPRQGDPRAAQRRRRVLQRAGEEYSRDAGYAAERAREERARRAQVAILRGGAGIQPAWTSASGCQP